MSSKLRFSLLLSVMTLGAAPAALAQGYFMPPSAPQSAPSAAPAQAAAPAAAPAPQPAQPEQQQVIQPPQLPALPAEAAPPTAVVGVLSVPDVMRRSSAVQGVQAEIQKRQAELSQEAQAARAKIQSEQQAIMAQRGKISDAALEAKEQALRDEIAATQTKFEERNQAIQNSSQAAVGQVEAELIAILRQEAQAHGINLVLREEVVLLNFGAFDLTDETVAELNKLLPSVKVPPSVVTPGMAINPPDQGDASQDGGQ